MSGIATAVVVAGVGGALIAKNAAGDAAKKQAGAIRDASNISAAAATEARADAIRFFTPALSGFTKSIQDSIAELESGATTTADIFRRSTADAETLLRQGNENVQRAILGLPPLAPEQQAQAEQIRTTQPVGQPQVIATEAVAQPEISIEEERTRFLNDTQLPGSTFQPTPTDLVNKEIARLTRDEGLPFNEARSQAISAFSQQQLGQRTPGEQRSAFFENLTGVPQSPFVEGAIRRFGTTTFQVSPEGQIGGEIPLPEALTPPPPRAPFQLGGQPAAGQLQAPGVVPSPIPTGLIGAERALGQTTQQALGAIRGGFGQARGDIGAARGRAIGELRGGEQRGLGEIRRGVTGAVGELEAFAGTGEQALQREAALSGALGPEAQQQAINAFIESPGQQFLRERQEQALLRSSAAIGGLGGGRVRTALQEQASGIAAQQQQQQIQNLRSLSGQGLQAAGQQAGFRQQGGLAGGQLVGQLAGQGAGIEAQLGAQLAQLSAQSGLSQGQLLQILGQQQAGLRTGAGTQLAGVAGTGAEQLAQQRLGLGQQLGGVQQQTSANIANLLQAGGAGGADIQTQLGILLGNIATGQGSQQAGLAQSLGATQAAGTLGQSAALQQGLGSVAQGLGMFTQNQQNQQLLDILAAR